MDTLNKVKEAMLSPYCLSNETKQAINEAKDIEACLHILNTEYGGANSMTFAVAFLAVIKALQVN